MENQSFIGLDNKKAVEIHEKLNELLAHYSVFYQNVRGYHWHVVGEQFFELHAKFEELYNNLLIKIDEIAERILTLGGFPKHQFSGYFSLSKIEESGEVSEGRTAVSEILNAFQTLLPIQRKLLELTAEADDEGTNSLLSDYIREQEKLMWMYSAYLK